MNPSPRNRFPLAIMGWLGAAAAATLVACGGGGGGTSAPTGTLRMAMTDAPACGFDHVFITVDRVRVNTSSSAADEDAGWREIVLPQPRRIDLLDLTNGVLEELGQTDLPPGNYTQMRLVLAPNTAVDPLANAVQPTRGALQALDTPSAQQSGLKLKTKLQVQENQTTDVVLDFDACRSIVQRGNSGRYNLKPVMSVLQRTESGIEGFVATSMPLATTVAAQQGGLTVRATVPDSTGRFRIPFLPSGSYDVVVNADGRSTAVVTGVPVGSTGSRTVINGTATAIVSPSSTMVNLPGTALLSQGANKPATTLDDVRVRALQPLTGGPTVEVANVGVDSDGAWLLRLPLAAPVRQAYPLTGTFAADTAVAGKFIVQAQAPDRLPLEEAVNLSAPPASLNFLFGQ